MNGVPAFTLEIGIGLPMLAHGVSHSVNTFMVGLDVKEFPRIYLGLFTELEMRP
jgi:hypothetical protein